MISLALLLGLLSLVPAISGVILMLAARALSRRVAAIWCGVVLLFSLIVLLFFVRLLAYGNTIESTAFAPSGLAHWFQLSYQVDSFNIFSALVVGVLASAVSAVLIAFEPAQPELEQRPQEREGREYTRQWNRTWQMGMLLLALGAIFIAIFANSALWMVVGWGLAGCCAFILTTQGQPRKYITILLATTCLASLALYLSLLPAIGTREDQRLDVLAGLGREPFWAALIMLAALVAPGVVLLIQQAASANAPPRPAGMGQSSIYVLMASPVTFTAFARLALLIAGPGEVTPGNGSFGWRAFSLVIVWTGAIIALSAALLALRYVRRSSLPIFLSIQLLTWMLISVAVTGTGALNGALMFKLLRLLALGALLLAGGHKLNQPILRMSWWLAALALSALPFTAGFSSAWLVTSGALAAGPAWVAGVGFNWLALVLITLAIARVGGTEAASAAAVAPPAIASQTHPLPSFLLFVLALLALALGIAPEVAVNFFTSPATNSLPVIASQSPGAGIQTNPLGLVSATGIWLPGLFWLLALALLLLCFLLTRHTRQPATVPPFVGGEAEAHLADDTIVTPSVTSSPRAGQESEPERPHESELSAKLE